MAAIDLVGHHVEAARARKPLHPGLYLLIGFLGLVGAALVLDFLAGLIV